MSRSILELPPLLLLDLPEQGSPALDADRICESGDLAPTLSALAQRARATLAPFLRCAAADLDPAREAAQRCASAFVEVRRQVWPILAEHLSRHPLHVFRLVRESVEAIREERSRWPLDLSLENEADHRAWEGLQAAVQTYAMTARLLTDRAQACLEALASGDPSAAVVEFQQGFHAFLDRLDRSTAAFEFGVVAVREMQRAGLALGGSGFQVACHWAARGADEQHVLVRQALRAILRDETAAAGRVPPPGTGETPSHVLFRDWVRAVLAA